jgi:uncharacterized protein (TIGR02271 family)
MTMQAEQLIGSRVIEGNGQVVGTVQQIFNDDKDGTPVWARIRAGTRELFVPLGGGRVTQDGLSVPFDTEQILSSPDIGVERHMSAAETDELKRHYGLTGPAQGGPPDADAETDADADAGQGQAPGDEAQTGRPQPGEAGRGEAAAGNAGRGEAAAGNAGRGEAAAGNAGRGETQPADAQPADAQDDAGQRGEDWLIRTEERVDVGTEMLESGRARLHKYVDTEPVEQTVHVFHEEYEVERVPISAQEQVSGEIAEGELEIVLHEERPVLHKEVVAVERIRLKVKRVDEDRTLRDEIRKERVEIEGDGGERVPQPAAR